MGDLHAQKVPNQEPSTFRDVVRYLREHRNPTISDRIDGYHSVRLAMVIPQKVRVVLQHPFLTLNPPGGIGTPANQH